MKIIMHGDINKILKIQRFRCNHCGCIFEATKNEYEDGGAKEPGLWCKCPDCGYYAPNWNYFFYKESYK